MAKTDTLTRISPYAERLFDDYVYDELEDAGKKLRAAYGRVSRRPSKAIEDPYVVRLVREAGESLRNAAVAVTGQPEPPSRKPRILAAAAVTVGTVLFVKRMNAAKARPEGR
jgi:hypothetical protein